MRVGVRKLSTILIVAAAVLIQGCGGSGSKVTTGTPISKIPTAKTEDNVATHIASLSAGLVGTSFTTFGAPTQPPKAPTSGGPVYDKRLGLWVVVTKSASGFTATFYQDQAETQPAGSAAYTANLSTRTTSGNISITAGKYSGLTGTYSETFGIDTLSGNYAITLPSGTTVSTQFTVMYTGGTKPSGTATQTITKPDGYSEISTLTYKSDGSMIITASDSNGYSSKFNVASDFSGSGTISGPDPGLPAKIVWNSVGTGTVTFANDLVINFTNWQFVPPPAK